ncbi:tetratricopeptide repeat protein [Colwelliaceae bacterium BS250]
MKIKSNVLLLLATTLLFTSEQAFDVNHRTLGSMFNSVHAAQNNKAESNTAQIKTKKVPAMRERVYAQLARAQAINDKGGFAQGIKVLDQVKDRLSSLNSYERAMLFNFYGFMYYGNNQMSKAIDNFENVVKEKDGIADTLYLSTQFSLAQLYMQQQDFMQAEQALKAWQAANTKPLTGEQHLIFAQIYYQQKDYQGSLVAVDSAIKIRITKGKDIKENWLILKRANHYELKQPKLVTAVLEDLVRLFNKPQYWLQLSSMYGEIGEEDKQLAVIEAAFQAGFVQKSEDIMTLAQLYIYHQLPFKGAVVLQESMDSGDLTVNEKRLDLLAQAYLLAKEDEKALPVLVKAAEISSSGKFDAQLAQVYLNLERWQDAINSAQTSLDRNNTKNPGDMHLAIGMSYFNLQKYEASLLALANAKRVPASTKMAEQWYQYVDKEKGYQMQLAQLTSSTEQVNE